MEITNCVTQETTNAAVMGLGSNEQEMLNFAIKNGIINLPHLQDQIEMMKNAEILQKPPEHRGFPAGKMQFFRQADHSGTGRGTAFPAERGYVPFRSVADGEAGSAGHPGQSFEQLLSRPVGRPALSGDQLLRTEGGTAGIGTCGDLSRMDIDFTCLFRGRRV